MKFTEDLKTKIEEESKNYVLFRSKERSQKHGEVFTPSKLVIEMLEHLPDDTWEPGKTFLDPSAGNGQFLAAVLITKLHQGHQNPLGSIYGIELLPDNHQELQQRLLKIAGDTKENQAIVNRNIVCADALTYDMSFGEVNELDEIIKW